jgi:hypothetical protein
MSEQVIAAALHAITQFLSPHLSLNTGPTATVAFQDCAVVHLETDGWLLTKVRTWLCCARVLSWPATIWLRLSCKDTRS